MNKEKILKVIKVIATLVVLLILLYTLIEGIITFWTGYNTLDTAQNFLQLGYNQDITIGGNMISLKDAYLFGLNEILWGFEWICFDVVLGVLLGWLLKRKY